MLRLLSFFMLFCFTSCVNKSIFEQNLLVGEYYQIEDQIFNVLVIDSTNTYYRYSETPILRYLMIGTWEEKGKNLRLNGENLYSRNRVDSIVFLDSFLISSFNGKIEVYFDEDEGLKMFQLDNTDLRNLEVLNRFAVEKITEMIQSKYQPSKWNHKIYEEKKY